MGSAERQSNQDSEPTVWLSGLDVPKSVADAEAAKLADANEATDESKRAAARHAGGLIGAQEVSYGEPIEEDMDEFTAARLAAEVARANAQYQPVPDPFARVRETEQTMDLRGYN